MKVWIESDEEFPVYWVDHNCIKSNKEFQSDIPEETLKRWKVVGDAYKKVQKEMKVYYDAQVKKAIGEVKVVQKI